MEHRSPQECAKGRKRERAAGALETNSRCVHTNQQAPPTPWTVPAPDEEGGLFVGEPASRAKLWQVVWFSFFFLVCRVSIGLCVDFLIYVTTDAASHSVVCSLS